MLQWLVNSGDRPKLDPPVGTGSSASDRDDDDDLHHHGVSLGQVRSRRRRLVRRKIHINPTHSSTGISDMGSDDDNDDRSSGPTPGPRAFHFDDDDATHAAYDLEACGSMLLEAVSMHPNRYGPFARGKVPPWKQLLLDSKPTNEPEGRTSPRKKLLKRMKGVVDVEETPSHPTTTKIDPLPSAPPVPGSDFEDEVLEEAMKMATKNHSLKHHSNLQRILRGSESSSDDDPSGKVRRGVRSPPTSTRNRDACRSNSPGKGAAPPSRKQRKHGDDYLIDSDNSILRSRTGSDAGSSESSLFETLQRAMQVQRAGRPSPPASPLPQPRQDRKPEHVYVAVQSTLDCDAGDDLILKSRTPRSQPYRSSPAPERLLTPLPNPKALSRHQDVSPMQQRKRRSRRRRQGFQSMSAGSGSFSDDDDSVENDKYATSWRKKQRVVSPTHSNTAHTISTQRRSNVTAFSECTALRQPKAVPSSSAGAIDGSRKKKGSEKGVRKADDSDHTSSSTLPDFLRSKCPDLILPGTKFLTSMQPSPRRKLDTKKHSAAAIGGNQTTNRRSLKSCPTRGTESADTGHDIDEEEPSKADIQARRHSGLRKPSLVDDSSAFVTTDEENQRSKADRGLARSRNSNAFTCSKPSGRGNHVDSPTLGQSRRFGGTKFRNIAGKEMRRGVDDFEPPSPVQSVDDHELDMLSILSGDCGGQAGGRRSSDFGLRPEPRSGRTDPSPTRGASRWSAFERPNTSSRVSDCLHDESRMSPLLVPQRRKPFRPPKPEKRKSRDCNPDLNVLDLHHEQQSSAYLGDCDVLSVFSGEVQSYSPPKPDESAQTTSMRDFSDKEQKKQPPAPERLKFRDCSTSRVETRSFAGHKIFEPRREAAMQSTRFHPRDQMHELLFESSSDDIPFEPGASASVVSIVPGTMDNPIVIGDQLISLKSKRVKKPASTRVDAPCDLFPTDGDCACIAHPHRPAVSRPVRAGSRLNPIIITDANVAIQASRIREPPFLTSSIAINMARDSDSRHQLYPLDVMNNDGGSDSENHPFPVHFGQPRTDSAVFTEATSASAANNGNSSWTRHQAVDAKGDDGDRFRAGQGMRMQSTSRGDHEQYSSLESIPTRAEKSTLWQSSDDCAPHDCGLSLDMLDYAGNRTDVSITGHQPYGDSAMKTLQSELKRQLGSSNGVVLFKPNICIYTKSIEKSTEHSDPSCNERSTPTMRESLYQVSQTIAKLEEKARQVDLVLSSALDQVHRSVPKPNQLLDVDDDDGMTSEMDRLSRCEEELRAELDATQKTEYIRPARLPEASLAHDNARHVPPARETMIAPSVSPTNHMRSLSPFVSMERNGSSAKFPVDLTDANDDDRSLSSCHETSSLLSGEIDRIISTEEQEIRRDYLYDAIPPLRRIRDQERTSRRRMKRRVSSILNLVDPETDDASMDEQSTCFDRRVGSGIVVLHHRNHDDVEIMRIPEREERQPEDSAEEIEVIFVEESFLSTDSFSFGETKGVYFDWKRSTEDELGKGVTDRLKQEKHIAFSPKGLHHPTKPMMPPQGGQIEGDAQRRRWTEKAVREMTNGLPSVLGKTQADNTRGRDQLRVIDQPIRNSSAFEASSRRSTSDPPGNGLRVSQIPEVAPPRLLSVPCTSDVRDLDLPGIRSGALSDVFSGIDDSVRYHSRVAVEDKGSMKVTTEDELKRRVEGIMRRSERSKRHSVRVLETATAADARPDAPSQTSSSMMDDEEDESSLSLTLSVATKESVTSNTSLASVASADAEEKLKALISRGKALVSREASTVLSLQRTQLREQNESPRKTVGTDVADTAAMDDNSSGEVSEWGSSRSVPATEGECSKAMPVQLFAEVKHVKIPKAACRVDGKPPPALCPSSRRLARLRRLQNNWTISANGYVVPKQDTTSTQIPQSTTASKGRQRFARRKFSSVSTQSNVCDESCSTLTPSVRRHPEGVSRYMPAIRMSSMLAKEAAGSKVPAASRNHHMKGTKFPTTGEEGAFPAIPAKKKPILGQLHLSRLLSKTKKNVEVKSPETNIKKETERQATPKKATPSSRLFQKTKSASPRAAPRKSQQSQLQVKPAGRRPTIPSNPFDSHFDGSSALYPSRNEPLRFKQAGILRNLSPTKRRLHLSRMPDFPDLLHPSLRSVLSYPPMSINTDATTQILSVRSSSPRSLKGLLPSHVHARNTTSALPGSLLWEATHGSRDA